MRRALRLLCDRSGGECDGQRVLTGLGTLAARLHAHPVPYDTPDGRRVMDDTALAAITFDLAGSRALMGRLPSMVDAALSGDYRPLTAVAAAQFPPVLSEQTVRPDRPSSAAQPATDQLYGLVTWAAMSCNDYPALWDRRAPVPVRTRQYEKAGIGWTRPRSLRSPRPRGRTASMMPGTYACAGRIATAGPGYRSAAAGCAGNRPVR